MEKPEFFRFMEYFDTRDCVWEMFQDNKEPLFLADDFDPYAVVKFNLLETSVRDLCHGLGYALKPPKQRGTIFDLRNPQDKPIQDVLDIGQVSVPGAEPIRVRA